MGSDKVLNVLKNIQDPPHKTPEEWLKPGRSGVFYSGEFSRLLKVELPLPDAHLEH